MKVQAGKIILGAGVFMLSVLVPNLSLAQLAAATPSGAVTDSSGRIVPGVKISVNNIECGQSIETEADPAGVYRASSLAPGDVSVSASAQQQAPANQPPAPPPANLPNAPSSTTASPSLQDLGFSANQTQGSAQEQALLNKRTHMLKVHQTLGLITLAPMVATLVGSGSAKTKHGSTRGTYIEPSAANLDLHIALGGLTGGMYAATAYYAIFAPKVAGVKPKGAIRLHRQLEWVHGPGMVLTGVLGIMAYQQENDGEKVHGIASAHGTVATVTVAAYAASLVSVSWPIHLKFWESR